MHYMPPNVQTLGFCHAKERLSIVYSHFFLFDKNFTNTLDNTSLNQQEVLLKKRQELDETLKRLEYKISWYDKENRDSN